MAVLADVALLLGPLLVPHQSLVLFPQLGGQLLERRLDDGEQVRVGTVFDFLVDAVLILVGP